MGLGRLLAVPRRGALAFGCLLASPLAWAQSEAQEAEPPLRVEPPHLDALAGASAPGDWALGLELGFPTLGMRGQLGLEPWGLNLVGLASTTVRTDHWGMVGVSKLWVEHSRFTLGGELLLGGTLRGGDLARRGPTLGATLRLARAQGRVVPALALSSRHVLLTDVTEIDTAQGLSVQRSRSLGWSPQASLDLGVGICPGFAVAAGLSLPWFEPPGFSLPGAHLTLIVGGWR